MSPERAGEHFIFPFEWENVLWTYMAKKLNTSHIGTRMWLRMSEGCFKNPIRISEMSWIVCKYDTPLARCWKYAEKYVGLHLSQSLVWDQNIVIGLRRDFAVLVIWAKEWVREGERECVCVWVNERVRKRVSKCESERN